MKTNLFIPDPLFESAKQLANELNISVNELSVAAIAAYIKLYRNNDITEQLNRVYETETSEIDPMIAEIQTVSISKEPENW
ncbi:MAG: hypothetical protein GY749_23875 [Desulfobacteraceae bacterium]|nr:hypothetical protein [Desulfobacteraceae bacterium]